MISLKKRCADIDRSVDASVNNRVQTKGVQRVFPLPGVWGCPPAIISPKTGGYRGFIKTISALSLDIA
jgi:hypothetical protein